ADRVPTTTRRVPTPARRRRTLVRTVAGLAVAALAALAIVVVPPLFATPPTARLVFATIPPGAAIELDGKSLGIADGTLAAADLALDRTYAVVARLDGYEDKRVVVQPHAGANTVTIALAARPRLELDSRPSAATVEIDRKRMGSTPLVVTSLAAGSTVTIVFARAGFRPATARVQVPPPGEVKRFVQPLEPSEDLVAVRFVSTPPGAEVVRTGQAPTTDRTYTPAELFVEVDQVQHFTLAMPKHVPVLLEPFTVTRGQTGLEKRGTLVPGFTLRLEGTGKATVARAPHCVDLALPADCVLAPGTYVVERGADKRAVTIEDRDVVLRL
ncbi:MAG TPA: PEGA domain-containing protein, partial [Kofleriaceae bacterium]